MEVRGQDCGQEAPEGQRVTGSKGVLQDNSQDRESHVVNRYMVRHCGHMSLSFFPFDLQRISTCLLKS